MVGDSYRYEENTVCGIGNNVSLVYSRLDFSREGAAGLTIRGRDSRRNTIHLILRNPEGEEKRQALEFPETENWEERFFPLQGICGMQNVTFLFLPGSCFDFDWFQFVTHKK